MTKNEFVALKEAEENVIEIIEDIKLKEFSQNCSEYLLSYIEIDEENKASLVSVQYYVINDTVYLRK